VQKVTGECTGQGQQLDAPGFAEYDESTLVEKGMRLPKETMRKKLVRLVNWMADSIQTRGVKPSPSKQESGYYARKLPKSAHNDGRLHPFSGQKLKPNME
jgi:hypothetical protein